LTGGVPAAATIQLDIDTSPSLQDGAEPPHEFATARLVVDDDLRENKGWTRRGDAGTEIRVATSADRLAFERLFLETITGSTVALGYVDATAQEIEYFEAVARINEEASAALDDLFERTATELGVEPGSEDGFVAVLATAFPEAFDIVLAGRVAAFRGLDPPEALGSGHDGLLAAWDRLLAVGEELIDEFAATQDFSVFEPAFGSLDDACRRLQAEIGLRLLDIDLLCNTWRRRTRSRSPTRRG
jgi:hypothetical protein